MVNTAGVFAVLAAFARPGLVVPHAVVPDISYIDWAQLRQNGVRHVVIDKDNCVTLPYQDTVAPGLESAWEALVKAGFQSILIVSNSAGSSDDPLAIDAEHVARQLGQPVLAHPSKKPAGACARQIVDIVFEQGKQAAVPSSDPEATVPQPLPEPAHIAVIGDRITTDIVLANRINRTLQKRALNGQAIGILTTHVLQRERWGTRLMRRAEMRSLARLDRMGIKPGQGWFETAQAQSHGASTEVLPPKKDWQTIVLDREAARLSAELEASTQTSTDAKQLLLQSLQQLLRLTARGIYVGVRAIAVFTGKITYNIGSNGVFWASKGRYGAQLPILHSIVQPKPSTTTDELQQKLAKYRRPSLFSSPYNYLLHRRLSRQSPLVGAQKRLFCTSPVRRAEAPNKRAVASPSSRPSPSTQPPVRRKAAVAPSSQPAARKIPLRNQVAFFAALVLLPTCWFGGAALNEYVNAPKERAELQRKAQEFADSRAATTAIEGPQSARTPSFSGNMASLQPSPTATTSQAPSHDTQSLQTARLHVLRDLANIEEKLERVQQRLRPDTLPAAATATSDDRQV